MMPEKFQSSLYHTHRDIAIQQKRIAEAESMRFAVCPTCGAEVFARWVVKHGQKVSQLFDRDEWRPHKFACAARMTPKRQRAAMGL